jgi:hypothetical protein
MRFLSILFIFSSLFVSIRVNAQSDFGHVVYEVHFDTQGLTDSERSMLPSEAHIWFRSGQMKMQMGMGPGMESAVMVRGEEVTMLFDFLGNRMAIRNLKSDLERKTVSTYRLNRLTGDVREIAGVACKKAVFSTNGEPDMIVWFSDRVKMHGNWYFRLEGLEGFPLEFDMKTNDVTFRMVARIFDTTPPNDAVFELSNDYKVMTQRELDQLMNAAR